MKVVITYGTFDLFHIGHVRLLKNLKKLGDKLIVGLSTDEFNQVKGKSSFFSYNERREILLSNKNVDDVFPEVKWGQKEEDIIKYQADIFAMGNDWEGKFDSLNEICKVIYLPRTEDISTTEIKKKLSLLSVEKINFVESALTEVFEVVKSLK